MSYRAFLSSTYEDLKEHRRKAIEALRRAGFVIDPMEDWTADTGGPKEFSQAALEGCDLFVLLVALRRGHIPNRESHSITQMEYDEAVRRGIDVLVFMLEENEPWPRNFDDLDSDPELRTWREKLSEERMVSLFSTAPESIEIERALSRWVQKRADGSQRLAAEEFLTVEELEVSGRAALLQLAAQAESQARTVLDRCASLDALLSRVERRAVMPPMNGWPAEDQVAVLERTISSLEGPIQQLPTVAEDVRNELEKLDKLAGDVGGEVRRLTDETQSARYLDDQLTQIARKVEGLYSALVMQRKSFKSRAEYQSRAWMKAATLLDMPVTNLNASMEMTSAWGESNASA